MRAVLLLFVLAPIPAPAQELGYALLHFASQEETTASARGVGARINFGGGHEGDRYSGDRWSLTAMWMQERESHGDGWIEVPGSGCCGRLESAKGFESLSFSHRWYTKRERFKWAPQLRLFVGTGVERRNARTCISEPAAGCFGGTPGVSSNWCFHQTAGFKWRERLELSVEHCSTGRVSSLNTGDNVYWFTLFPVLGRR